MSFDSKVAVGLGWMAGANFLSQVVTWAITIVVMRILSPSDYGLLAMASVFVALLSMMATAGLGPAIVQASEIDDAKLRQLLGLIIVLNIVLFLLLFFAAQPIATFFDEPRLTDIIRVLSAQFVVAGFAVIPESLLGRALKFKMRALVDLSSHVAGAVVTLVLALSGYGVWSLIAGTIVSVTGKSIGLNIAAPYLRWPDFSLRGTGPLIAFGSNVTAARVLWFFYSQADMFIAGKLLGKEALGFYSVAMHLASLPVQKISGVLNQVAFPAFSQIQHDLHVVAAQFLKAARLLSFFAFPVLWGISSIAPELVRLVLGAKWDLAIFPLQVLPAIMPLRMISNFLPSAVDAVGRPDISVKNLISACLIMPTAFFVGSKWGVEGLCMAWLIGFPLVFLGNLRRALPAIGLTVGDVVRAMAWPALASMMMYGSVVFVSRVLLMQTHDAEKLALMVLIGAIVYGGLAITTNRDGCKLVIGALRR